MQVLESNAPEVVSAATIPTRANLKEWLQIWEDPRHSHGNWAVSQKRLLMRTFVQRKCFETALSFFFSIFIFPLSLSSSFHNFPSSFHSFPSSPLHRFFSLPHEVQRLKHLKSQVVLHFHFTRKRFWQLASKKQKKQHRYGSELRLAFSVPLSLSFVLD